MIRLFYLLMIIVFFNILDTHKTFNNDKTLEKETFHTPDFSNLQEYLDKEKGMNIRKAWEKGISGKGVIVHLVDSALPLSSHENIGENLKVISNFTMMDNQYEEYAHHGLASLGLIIAKAKESGIKGIAYKSELNFYTSANEEEMISLLSHHVKKGDIVSLNIQINSDDGGLMPTTGKKTTFHFVNELVNKGAVVLAAAGNGSNNLSEGVSYFRNYGDSGIILVGASNPTTGRRLPFSNYNNPHGKMINSWGADVVTIGYGDLQNSQDFSRLYTSSFAGTSSATPLATGALALIQSYYKEKSGGETLNNQEIYELVSKTGYTEGIQDGIGVRPNVYQALLEIDRIFKKG